MGAEQPRDLDAHLVPCSVSLPTPQAWCGGCTTAQGTWCRWEGAPACHAKVTMRLMPKRAYYIMPPCVLADEPCWGWGFERARRKTLGLAALEEQGQGAAVTAAPPLVHMLYVPLLTCAGGRRAGRHPPGRGPRPGAALAVPGRLGIRRRGFGAAAWPGRARARHGWGDRGDAAMGKR